jgi:hypothetical protein
MLIIYSEHALLRMRQKGITKFEVEYVLDFAKCFFNSRDNTKIVLGEINNKTLKVIFIEKENYKRIITIR